ncbi:hypothetical protein [Streptomyces sp. HUAS TT7]|uniref:hypothetical protein n=1 Tax=Streptomyces sp. HUAS TT7 TaxID=3447507 RepID=UPI003F65DCD0
MPDTQSSSRPDRRTVRLAAVASAALLSLAVGALPAGAAIPPPASVSASAVSTPSGLDRKALSASLEAFHQAGMYGPTHR